MADINLEEKDYQRAVTLLGREPRTPFVVKTKCENGFPQTIVANPVFVEDNIWKPFPAFIWLVCPKLKALAADLEQEGFVKSYSQRLQNDETFRNDYLKGQREIADYRLELANKVYKDTLPEHIYEILKNTSVAGSHDVCGVKCLHAHLAHYLAFGNNPIGKEVFEKIEITLKDYDCDCELVGGEK